MQVIRPAKLWCDVESADEARELSEKFGYELVPGFTASKILWLKRKEPQHFARLRHVLLVRCLQTWMRRLPVVLTSAPVGCSLSLPTRVCLQPHDYINFYLTGRMVMECGDASGTGDTAGHASASHDLLAALAHTARSSAAASTQACLMWRGDLSGGNTWMSLMRSFTGRSPS